MTLSPLSALQSLLAHQRVALIDGAVGTELERRGVSITGSKLWSAQLLITNPTIISNIHKEYYAAGADIVCTTTYQASVEGFLDAGVSRADCGALFVKAVELADAARCAFWEEHTHAAAADPSSVSTQPRHRPLVAYSCGAYGASLADGSEYSGAYADMVTEEQLMAFHKARLDPVRGHPAVDMIAFETIPCLKEVRAIVRLLDIEDYGVPAMVSLQCRDSATTARGEDVATELVPVLAGCRAVAAFGFNCVAPERVPALLTAARGALEATAVAAGAGAGDHPAPLLLCYPNSGEGWDTSLKCWTEAQATPGLLGAGLQGASGPETFATQAEGWVAAGARLVGGCCRTTPAHIAELRRRLLG
ncbi:hypothetical protein FOA52_012512 [Chlamydomonas sp. UWO 241]|nr:hypothetical protein FOA52_012512 [Chlamydomonas sp. UWO 241]